MSYNMPQNSPQGYWNSTTPFINGSSNPKEVANLAQFKPPYGNEYTHDDYKSVRKSGVVEKCIFCEHRTKVGKQPYCVEVCPSKARIFGDKDDPESSVSKLLAKYKSQSFQNNKGEFLPENEKGTSPNVYYINREKREEAITGIVEETKKEKLFTVYPNPANGYMNIEVNLQNDDTVSIMLYDISGKFAKQLLTNEYVPKGIHTYTREVYNLKPGLYICKVQLSNTFQSQRVVIY
ncbi:MAG: T9SS type A sorting domain-containing protein [Cyclobacteriaceae bacterium]|nr:T9SS type A sorting domain-containing protein [Cyclobacteriaceae bacterium]